MNTATVPAELHTERLYLRCWRRADASCLLPVLEANADHLGAWIPARVVAPAPLGELKRRLAGFAEDFAAARKWRYAIFGPDERDPLGEASLFPRSPEGRVSFPSADRAEIGYWLSRKATGRGYATEAARAMLALARSLPGIRRVEIRCDPRNASSAAVPKRLGFRLIPEPAHESGASAESDGMLWVYDDSRPRG